MNENVEMALWILLLVMILAAVKLLKILGYVEESFANQPEVAKADAE